MVDAAVDVEPDGVAVVVARGAWPTVLADGADDVGGVGFSWTKCSSSSSSLPHILDASLIRQACDRRYPECIRDKGYRTLWSADCVCITRCVMQPLLIG